MLKLVVGAFVLALVSGPTAIAQQGPGQAQRLYEQYCAALPSGLGCRRPANVPGVERQ